MVRIDYLIFGYRRLTLSGTGITAAANSLLRLGISASLDESGSFTVGERDFRRIRASGIKIEYTVSELFGIPGFLRRNRHRYFSFVVLILTAFFVHFLSGLVWDVRIVGNSSLDEAEVRQYLSECNLRVGKRWRGLGTGEVETELLSKYPDIAWAAVNRRGTVAFVEIVEREGGKGDTAGVGYRNIVASADAVIEEITVIRGVAAVKAGDVVRRGDILISGILPEESGGGFCCAEGEVRGVQRGEISIEVGRYEEITVKERGEATSLSVKIFGVLINIFKKYGNSSGTYGIIEDEEELWLFGKHRLPVSIVRTYPEFERSESVTYAEWEMVSVAHKRMREAISDFLGEAELIKMRSSGEYTEYGYRAYTSVVYSGDIGLAVPFEVVGEK